MPKVSDNTLRELEDILNESETYADRLTAFLKLKTAPKPANNGPLLMCDADLSFDFDVDLIKLPPKQQPASPKDAISVENKEHPLPCPIVSDTQECPPTSPARTDGCPVSNASSSGLCLTSPRKSLTRRSGIHVPGSDRLRRVAIQRRSRSCGRRDLLNEFNNLSKLSSNFEPTVSSTPASEKKDTAKPAESPQEKFQQEQRDEQLSQASNHSVKLSSQRSSSPDCNNKRRTYTIEMGPEPGQLLLSPSIKSTQNVSVSNASLRQARSRLAQYREQAELSAARLKILAPDTPARALSHTLPNPEYIVPETQPQPMLKNLSNNALVTPFMVVPINSMLAANAQAANAIAASAIPAAAPVDAAVQVKPAPSATVANRSMQTSCSPAAVQKLEDIMTDDDSEEERQSSRVPLNLAAATGNNNRQRSLRSRVQRVDNSMQLLDLHQSRSSDSRERDQYKPRQTVLNKPSQPAINGEQFAFELARMSNYEILDLRKRNSLGRHRPVNGHRQQSTEQEKQQMLLDQHIEWEILRRNLEEQTEQDALPKTVPMSQDETLPAASLMQSPAVPPMDFRDNTLEHQENSFVLQAQRSHNKRRETLRQTFELPSMSPAAPPADFRDNSLPPQQRTRRLRSRRHEPPMSEDELLTVCTPPSQFRKSRSRQRENRQSQVVEPVPPPYHFSDNAETDIEEENQEQEQQLLPPAQFVNETHQIHSILEEVCIEEIAANEKPSSSSFAQRSMRLRTSTQLKKSEVQPQIEQIDLQEKQEENQQRKGEKPKKKEQQERELREKQQMENENKKKLEKEIERQQRELMDIQEKEKKANEQKKQQENEAREQQDKQLEEQHKRQQEEEKEKEEQQHQENIGQQPREEEELEKEVRQEKEQSKLLKRKVKGQMQKEAPQLEQQELHHDEPIQLVEPAPPEDVFKKPTAPAPRSKANKKSRLEKQLLITVGDATLPPDERDDDANTTGVRRSRRGQVPLCNTWVHSISDPFQFMRKMIDPPKKSSAKKPKKRTASTADGGCSMINKPPLSASTPRSTAAPSNNKRTKQQQPHQDKHQSNVLSTSDAISGITRLNYITEEDEPVEPEAEAVINVVEPAPVPKKRGHKKKTPADSTEPNKETKDKEKKKKRQPAATAVEQIAEEHEEDAMPIPDQPGASPLPNQSHDPSSETLMSWLCGARELPPDNSDVTETKTDSMSVSRAANLHFSNIDGIEYAFYHTEDRYSMGYMRFQPLQQRGMKRAKTNTLRFVALHGNFEFEIVSPESEETCHDILYTGDTIEIKKGSRYDIKNRLDKVSIIMVYRN
ncbi:trichohyalin isoform X2 [Drosophila mojavensis]|uniref:trichohyalin isoform X2 n=1 Tax=Drosophila mojavensis TaxID=7230 RepID=UPI001CD0F168|nr:trichohyalin isoform X2 [Drosophila mojavensis]